MTSLLFAKQNIAGFRHDDGFNFDPQIKIPGNIFDYTVHVFILPTAFPPMDSARTIYLSAHVVALSNRGYRILLHYTEFKCSSI